MDINTLKLGENYYIVHTFFPDENVSIKKGKCILKTQGERLENEKVIINGKAMFEVDANPYHDRYMFTMDYIKDHIFAEFNDAYTKLNELKQNSN